MGYMAVNGVITPGGSALGPLQVGSVTNPASETQHVQVTSNLDAGGAVGSVLNAPVTIYDSLGVSHNLNIAFTKTGPNAWSYAVTMPAADFTAGGGITGGTGNLTFNSSGVLTAPANNVTFGIAGLADKAADMTAANGNTAITWQLYDSSNNPVITQLAGSSTTSGTSQDGYSSGTLQSFTVDASGVIQGSFSNNRNAAVGQVALAMFGNPQGLQRSGDNAYAATLSSGQAVIGVPGSGGRGNITGGALELSNVDVATEFSKMIIAQRGYEANAKVVTTMNTVTQDTINLIQG
jgi:flagellar hook protein FlgE